jgi:hypothetical protein
LKVKATVSIREKVVIVCQNLFKGLSCNNIQLNTMTFNTISNNSQINVDTKILNKGFLILDELFQKHGWHLIKNEMNWICYTKVGQESDLFDIKISQKIIQVSIPIKNSPFQYHTSFTDYFQASEYIEERFFDFIDKKN